MSQGNYRATLNIQTDCLGQIWDESVILAQVFREPFNENELVQAVGAKACSTLKQIPAATGSVESSPTRVRAQRQKVSFNLHSEMF
jgi:hypothetical protein